MQIEHYRGPPLCWKRRGRQVHRLGFGESGRAHGAWWNVGLIGGSCPNIACLPKQERHSSRKGSALLFGRAAEFGIRTDRPSSAWKAFVTRKRRMVEGLIQLHMTKYKESGAELILGEGRFIGPKTSEVQSRDGDTRHLAGDRIS